MYHSRHGKRDGHHWYASLVFFMLDSDLDLGPITGTCYNLFQKEIRNIPTVTPSLFYQTRRIAGHNVSVTRYKSVIKNGHDWSPASIVCSYFLSSVNFSLRIILIRNQALHLILSMCSCQGQSC